MNRSTIFAIIFTLLTFGASDISYAQKPKEKKTTATTTTNAVDSLLNDTSFVNSIGGAVFWDCGEFVSSQYKIQFPIKCLGWISDYEHIFTTDQIRELDSIISHFEKETTNEIAIVTIDSSWTTDENFENLIKAIGNEWGVGKKAVNNGVVIGISTGLRKIRISNGYGIEIKLTDKETKKIIDDIIVPEFKNGNYFEGTKNMGY